MNIYDIVSVVSIVIAIASYIHSYITSSKKYELQFQYRVEIMKWYSDTMNILTRLIIETKDGFADQSLKKELLSTLSSNIEIGRFYFPNVDSGNGFGNHKPIAYQGYRNLTIVFLVYSFKIFEKKDAAMYLNHAEELKRQFTSHLFEILDPKQFLKETYQHTKKKYSNDLTFNDFIRKDPLKIDFHSLSLDV